MCIRAQSLLNGEALELRKAERRENRVEPLLFPRKTVNAYTRYKWVGGS